MMDNKQIRELIESVIFDQPDDCSGWGSYEQGQIDEARRIYRELMTKFPIEVKLAVVPWTESKIGDVVRIGNRLYKLHEDADTEEGQCCKCAFQSERGERCPYSSIDKLQLLCYSHESGCDVYFTEVE